MGDVDRPATQPDLRLRRVYLDLMASGEVIGQEEVVVSLEEVNPHAPPLHGRQAVDDGLEPGIHNTVPGEPEIEQVSHDKELIKARPDVPQKVENGASAVPRACTSEKKAALIPSPASS